MSLELYVIWIAYIQITKKVKTHTYDIYWARYDHLPIGIIDELSSKVS